MKGSKPTSSAGGIGGDNSTVTSSSAKRHHRLNQNRRDNIKNSQNEKSDTKFNNNNNTNTNNNNRKKETTDNNHQQKSSTSDSNICNICAQNVPGPEREKIFAFSRCDHYVCYVCLTRLRVICDQNECPICREKLEDVIFRSDRKITFDKCDLTNYIYDDKHKIYFEDELIKKAFEKLLKFRCLECPKKVAVDVGQENATSSADGNVKKDCTTSGSDNSSQNKGDRRNLGGALSAMDTLEFDNIASLRQHLDRLHRLKLCELCLTHNKLFPFEFSYYTGSSLRDHMKYGEPNTSHKGHPICRLCQQTFFNSDELIQHMSREHYHCFLCGRHDSNMLIYFLDYEGLRQHFKLRHFLCERGNCRHEQFTSAFDSKIDYQLHIVQVHGGSSAGLSRGEARQQRTITLDSTMHREQTPSRSDIPPNAAVVSTGLLATANSSRRDRAQLPEAIRAQLQQQQQQRRLPTRAEFPALGFETYTATSTNPPSNSSQFYSGQNNTSTTNQFPALPTGSVSTTTNTNHRVIAGPSSARSFVRSAGGGFRAPTQLDEMDFPPLPEQPKVKAKNKKSKPQQQARPRDDGPMTLDQLISRSLSLTAQNNANRKNGAKGGKNIKSKAIKIQL